MGTAVIETAPVFSIQDSIIDELVHDGMLVAVDDPNDKKQVAIATEAWRNLRNARLLVEKSHKELKAEALAYSQACDAEKRRLIGKISPAEEHCAFQKDAPKREAERVAKEAQEKRAAKLTERMAQLAEIEFYAIPTEVEKLSDESFGDMLAQQRELKQERDDKAAADAEAARIEAERLKAEREGLDRQRAAQEAEQARLAAENAKLEAAAAAVRHAEELAKARAEAAEAAARQERERTEREAAEAKAKAEREEAERLRREAAAPDRDKLIAFSKHLESFEHPTLSENNEAIELEIGAAFSAFRQIVLNAAERLA